MTSDPFPDLAGAEPPDLSEQPVDDGEPGERPELSAADSRLLEALSRPEPPVVTAVEDQPRTAPAAQDDTSEGASGRRPLDPVFQEPPA